MSDLKEAKISPEEVAAALPDEVLIAVLVERGVLVPTEVTGWSWRGRLRTGSL